MRLYGAGENVTKDPDKHPSHVIQYLPMEQNPVIQVFLLDDHEIVRRGVRELLESEPDIEVVGEASTAAEAIQRIPAVRPHVAVLDVRLLDSIDSEVTEEVAAVVREALSNVARHSHAHKVEVSLSHVGERLAVVIADDGAGIPSSHRLGSGLLNMHDRASRLNGTCTVTSGEGAGTTVRWQVPVGS